MEYKELMDDFNYVISELAKAGFTGMSVLCLKSEVEEILKEKDNEIKKLKENVA